MLLLLTLACAPPEPGLLYEGERLPVADMHLHTGEWSLIPEATQSFLAERFPSPLGLFPEQLAAGVLSGEGLVEELDKAGVSRGVLLAVYAPRTVGVTSNASALETLAVNPERLYGMASLPTDNWDEEGEAALEELRDTLAQPGMIGIKLAHAHQRFRMDDPRYFGIYEVAAEAAAPVYLHTGSSPFPGISDEAPYTDPAWLEDAISAYPDADFILGHLGYDFINREEGAFETCLDLALRYPNVYLEPSALGSASSDPDGAVLADLMGRIRDAGLVDRVIYGSDGPQSPGFVAEYLERTAAAMEARGYTVDEARAVFSENFVRVYGVEEVSL